MFQGVVTHILLMDARTISRVGLRVLLEGEPDLHVVGEIADIRNSPTDTVPPSPHVVIFDGHSDSPQSAEMLRWLAGYPADRRPRVLALINDFDDEARRLLAAGVRGVLLSRSSPEEIVAAIRMVAAGYRLLIPSTGEEVSVPRPRISDSTAAERQKSNPALSQLTRRERDVFRLLARGCSNAEISEKLFLSESTVKSHVQRLLDKLDLRNRVHAVIYAYEQGMVQAGANALAAVSG